MFFYDLLSLFKTISDRTFWFCWSSFWKYSQIGRTFCKRHQFKRKWMEIAVLSILFIWTEHSLVLYNLMFDLRQM
jgi:hypothetical protein